MIFGTPGTNIDDAKALLVIGCSMIMCQRLHREHSREEGDTRQNSDIQLLLPARPIDWVSRILALCLLPSDLDEAALILDACNILFDLLALGGVVRIAGLIFAGHGILGLKI
jgi:hypothetical protein